ncbi:MAG TPA: M1 family metallopeptidase, partial [Flavisolibacter sp.]|nr:M1 family metallopeptidase [Flavisolibacter sp.]
MKKHFLSLFAFSLVYAPTLFSQPLNQKETFNHQDTLRGSVGPQRSWWDVLHYDISVTPDYNSKTIKGKTTITYKIIEDKHNDYLQVDLQKPLLIDTIFYNNKLYINYPPKPYYNEGNVWHIPLPRAAKGSVQTITIAYHGQPREAIKPPWDGGWIWKKDKAGNPWMSVACQGLGASVWYPCKDYQGDEPDNGATLTINIPDSLVAVGNGRLKNKTAAEKTAIYTWEVTAPINNYNIIPYIGKYVNWTDTLHGEKGILDLGFWVLQEDLEKAKKQFEQVKPMIRAFEYWFGPYPFYEDGYKLVQAPHLGMEHQSAVAYGNGFQNGYLGRDLSGTGWGLKWDFIIVHESGHEWFANNITTKDIADMWVHEGFTNYSEVLFIQYYYGKQAAEEYLQGIRNTINNDVPVIGTYGVNKEGSGDMYAKGANLIHTIRQVINNDSLFRSILRGLNKDFYHQTVTSKQVENYISQKSGKDLSKIFDQYLRTTMIPVLQLKASGAYLKFKWTNTIKGFNMPVRLTNGQWIHPTMVEQKIKLTGKDINSI